jgi:hypothetical protein
MGNDDSVGIGWKRLEIIGKILIPVTVALLVYITDSASHKISESQSKLAEAEYISALEASGTELELKYLEIFYTEIRSNDPSRQELALEILKMLDPELGNKLAKVVSRDSSRPQAVREHAQTVAADIGKVIASPEYKKEIEDKKNIQMRFIDPKLRVLKKTD